MKLTKIFSGTAAVVCLLFCASAGNAQTLYGRTEVKYNETTRYMTATSSTEIDFSAMEFYQGYVNIKLTDGGGSTMAVQTLADTDRDGFVEYSNTFAAGADYSEYMLKGTHRARMDIQDPALNYRYVDFYYFGYNLDMGSEGGNAWRYVMFIGPGPRKNWTTPWLTVDGTYDANIALDMPQGYDEKMAQQWDRLTPDEKKWVIANPQLGISFLVAAGAAEEDTRANFFDLTDGTRANAFQHAFWNALMTQAGGPYYAEQFANLHEYVPAPIVLNQKQTTLRNMDFFNNSVGRQIGSNNPFASRRDLVNMVINALNSGQLQYVCPPTCP
ncbi:MAG TPA: hypothetical protein DC047_10980 [Blastocatellia bacterium]|nr:hypothetical protein [Blastocatellia bacterium]